MLRNILLVQLYQKPVYQTLLPKVHSDVEINTKGYTQTFKITRKFQLHWKHCLQILTNGGRERVYNLIFKTDTINSCIKIGIPYDTENTESYNFYMVVYILKF